jgi:hypothetical protein
LINASPVSGFSFFFFISGFFHCGGAQWISQVIHPSVFRQELSDRSDHTSIDLLLRPAGGFELRPGHCKRMISSLDDVQFVHGLHLPTDIFEQVEGTERVARALHKEDWRPQLEKHLVAKLCRITCAAKRIAEAYDCRDFLFEGEMTSDAGAHALANQNRRPIV